MLFVDKLIDLLIFIFPKTVCNDNWWVNLLTRERNVRLVQRNSVQKPVLGLRTKNQHAEISCLLHRYKWTLIQIKCYKGCKINNLTKCLAWIFLIKKIENKYENPYIFFYIHFEQNEWWTIFQSPIGTEIFIF